MPACRPLPVRPRGCCRAASSSGWRSRALSLEPEVLFLDEPTASLDPASTLGIEQLIQKAAADGTKIVLVTHDLGQARRIADEVVFLYRGRIEAFEPAPTFFDAPGSERARAFIDGRIVL